MAAVVAGALVAAACSSSSDDAGKPRRPDGTTSADSSTPTPATAPPDTVAPESLDGSTPIAAPDARGLPAVGEPDPDIVRGELDNGLRYIIRENDSPGGSVEMRLAVDAGSALQTPEQDGVAHFLEHMMFNGTEKFPENELIATLRGFGSGFGADINAYTSYDETVYQLTVPNSPKAVGTGLDVLEQWLSAATLDEAQVEAERGVILDEWRGSATTSDGRIEDTFESLLLTGSPYEGKDPIGEESSIAEMTAAPLRDFYDDWYRPDNAAVIVVGDVDADRIEEQIAERFGSAVARGDSPERPDVVVEPGTEPSAAVLADPDVADGFAHVMLPSPPRTGMSPEEEWQAGVLERLAFDIIATRLANDARRGDAPFDDAATDGNQYARGIDTPGIVVSAGAADMEASVQAVLDEYERVRRFGFTDAEVDRAAAAMRARWDSIYDGRDSRQDALYAEEYVRHFLVDEVIPTADVQDEFIGAVLDRATPETVAHGFVQRLATSPLRIAVVVPAGDDPPPGEDVFVAQARSLADRELEARPDEAEVDGALMAAPDPVEEVSAGELADGRDVSFVAPRVLEFANGVTVSLNRTAIVEGQVEFEARRTGGLSTVADEDVAAGQAAGPVIGQSGVSSFDPVALEAALADKDVLLRLGIDPFAEGMYGTASTSDLETLFQLIHLSMTEPRVDEVALEQYIDDEMPYAEDPSIDPGYAEYRALLDARYDDPRFRLPTAAALGIVTADGIDRVMRERFGDASDFSFAFSGDLDLDEATELARRYLGTLPSGSGSGSGGSGGDLVDVVEPGPPSGVVTERVTAGDGEQASVSLLFTAPATTERVDDVAALVAQTLITDRLTDTIREELGESYSPVAYTEVGAGATPWATTYVSSTTGVDLVDDLSAAVMRQLDDLRRNGPTEAEHDAAMASVGRELDLFSNGQINDEVLDALTDPAGSPSFDDFLGQARLLDSLDRDRMRRYLADWLPADDYIRVVVVPR